MDKLKKFILTFIKVFTFVAIGLPVATLVAIGLAYGVYYGVQFHPILTVALIVTVSSAFIAALAEDIIG